MNKKQVAVAAVAGLASLGAFATAPDTTWITSGFSTIVSDTGAYIGAAFPYVGGLLGLVLGVSLVMRLVKRGAK